MQHRLLKILIGLALVASCATCDDNQTATVYALVTHGSSVSSYWQTVFTSVETAATRNHVKIAPFFAETETSGEVLNAKMQEALDLKPTPAGIIGTIWGDGMVDKVRKANTAQIPIVAIDVFPDASAYVGNTLSAPSSVNQGGFLYYTGIEDTDTTRKTLMATIQYAKDGFQWKGDETRPPSCSTDWAQCLSSLGLKQVVLGNAEATGGIGLRLSAASQFLSELGQPGLLKTLDTSQIQIEDRIAVLDAYFRGVQPTERVIFISLGQNVAEAYLQVSTNWTPAQKARVIASTFDLGQVIKNAVLQGDLVFGVDGGESILGDRALQLLITYGSLGRLPTTQEVDNRWLPKLTPFPWYKTGPTFTYAQDLK